MSEAEIDRKFRLAVAGKPYRPSNGTEGECFFEGWCMKCARDKSMSEGKDFDQCAPDEICQLIGDSMAFNPDEPGYPKEWVYDENGYPKCTAFVPVGEPIPRPRDDKTPDMFGGAT